MKRQNSLKVVSNGQQRKSTLNKQGSKRSSLCDIIDGRISATNKEVLTITSIPNIAPTIYNDTKSMNNSDDDDVYTRLTKKYKHVLNSPSVTNNSLTEDKEDPSLPVSGLFNKSCPIINDVEVFDSTNIMSVNDQVNEKSCETKLLPTVNDEGNLSKKSSFKCQTEKEIPTENSARKEALTKIFKKVTHLVSIDHGIKAKYTMGNVFMNKFKRQEKRVEKARSEPDAFHNTNTSMGFMKRFAFNRKTARATTANRHITRRDDHSLIKTCTSDTGSPKTPSHLSNDHKIATTPKSVSTVNLDNLFDDEIEKLKNEPFIRQICLDILKRNLKILKAALVVDPNEKKSLTFAEKSLLNKKVKIKKVPIIESIRSFIDYITTEKIVITLKLSFKYYCEEYCSKNTEIPNLKPNGVFRLLCSLLLVNIIQHLKVMDRHLTVNNYLMLMKYMKYGMQFYSESDLTEYFQDIASKCLFNKRSILWNYIDSLKLKWESVNFDSISSWNFEKLKEMNAYKEYTQLLSEDTFVKITMMNNLTNNYDIPDENYSPSKEQSTTIIENPSNIIRNDVFHRINIKLFGPHLLLIKYNEEDKQVHTTNVSYTRIKYISLYNMVIAYKTYHDVMEKNSFHINIGESIEFEFIMNEQKAMKWIKMINLVAIIFNRHTYKILDSTRPPFFLPDEPNRNSIPHTIEDKIKLCFINRLKFKKTLNDIFGYRPSLPSEFEGWIRSYSLANYLVDTYVIYTNTLVHLKKDDIAILELIPFIGQVHGETILKKIKDMDALAKQVFINRNSTRL